MGDGCISARIGLKISNISIAFVFAANQLLSIGKLSADRKIPIPGEVSGSSFAAENAASVTEMSVPVRAGHAAIQSNLIEFPSISFFQIIIQRIISSLHIR